MNNLSIIQEAQLVTGNDNQLDFGYGIEAELFTPQIAKPFYGVMITDNGALYSFIDYKRFSDALDGMVSVVRHLAETKGQSLD